LNSPVHWGSEMEIPLSDPKSVAAAESALELSAWVVEMLQDVSAAEDLLLRVDEGDAGVDNNVAGPSTGFV